MNRRGFLGTLLGAAVAPFLPKPAPPPGPELPIFATRFTQDEWDEAYAAGEALAGMKITTGIRSFTGVFGRIGT